MSEEVELPPRFWSLSAWCLGIIIGYLGIDPYFSERRLIWISSLGYYVPWFGGNFSDYFLGVILWSVVFCYLLIIIHRQYRGSFGQIASLMALLTGITWTSSAIISQWFGLNHVLFEFDSVLFRVVYVRCMLLSAGVITMGIAMVLFGVIYAQNLSGTSRILLPLVVISFVVVGFFSIIIGGLSFNTPYGLFNIFDIPLISIVMIIPCSFGVLYHLDKMIDHLIAEYRHN